MRNGLRFGLRGVICICTLAAAIANGQPRYQFTEIPPPDGKTSIAPWGINNEGTVVGMAANAFYVDNAPFIWTSAAGTQVLPTPAGTVSTAALGTNAAGLVVGWGTEGNGTPYPSHAFAWAGSSRIDLPGLPKANYGVAYAVNNNGVLFGHSAFYTDDPAACWQRAVVWERRGIRTLANLPGHKSSGCFGANERDQQIGFSMDDPPIWGLTNAHPLIWDHGAPVDLGSLGGTTGAPFGINNRGQVVGYSETANGEWHPFLWEKGKMVDLAPTGCLFGQAMSINGRGQVVGWIMTPEFETYGFLWEKGIVYNLNDLVAGDPGWTIGYGDSINDAGQIAVDGADAGWVNHAALLTPASR